jgi:hypothetical protein
VVRVDGQDQKYDRNQVQKIILVERVTTQQPPVTQPVPQKPKLDSRRDHRETRKALAPFVAGNFGGGESVVRGANG